MEMFLTGALTLISSPMSVFIFLAALVGGMLFGAIPGVNMLTLAAIFLPFSGMLSASDAIMFYSVLYCSGTYGGAVTAILFNIQAPPRMHQPLLTVTPWPKKGWPERPSGQR